MTTLPRDVMSIICEAAQPTTPIVPSRIWREVTRRRLAAVSVHGHNGRGSGGSGALRLVCRDFCMDMMPHISSLAYKGPSSTDGTTLHSLLTKLGRGRGRGSGSGSKLRRLDVGQGDVGPTLDGDAHARAALGGLEVLRVAIFRRDPGGGRTHWRQDAEVVQLLGMCPRLLELEMDSWPQLDPAALQDVHVIVDVASLLGQTQHLQHLQRLRLHRMCMESHELANLQQLLRTHLTSLVELDMEGTCDLDGVTPLGVVAAVLANGRLTRLLLPHWNNCAVFDYAEPLMQALGAAAAGLQLQAVDMEGVSVHCGDAVHLLRRNPQLEELALTCDLMDEQQLQHAEQMVELLAGMTCMKELRLTLNHSDAALAARALAGSAASLRSLSYSARDDVVMTGIPQLAGALAGMTLLEELDLVLDAGSSLAQLLRPPMPMQLHALRPLHALRRLHVDVRFVRATWRDAAALAASLASLTGLEHALLKFRDGCLASTQHEASLAAAAAAVTAALPADKYDVMRLAAAVARALPAMLHLRALDCDIRSEDPVDGKLCQDAAGIIARAATLAPALQHCSVSVNNKRPTASWTRSGSW